MFEKTQAAAGVAFAAQICLYYKNGLVVAQFKLTGIHPAKAYKSGCIWFQVGSFFPGFIAVAFHIQKLGLHCGSFLFGAIPQKVGFGRIAVHGDCDVERGKDEGILIAQREKGWKERIARN